MPEVSGKLDFSLVPGDSSRKRWHMRVSEALSQNSAKAGKAGCATIWRLNEVHTPAKPASKIIQGGKGKFMGKGKSMGQGGH